MALKSGAIHQLFTKSGNHRPERHKIGTINWYKLRDKIIDELTKYKRTR